MAPQPAKVAEAKAAPPKVKHGKPFVNFLREVRRVLIWAVGGVFWCIAPIYPEASAARHMYEAAAMMDKVTYTLENRNATMESVLLARAQMDDRGEWVEKAPQWTAEALPTPTLWELMEPRIPAQAMTYLGGSIMIGLILWMIWHKPAGKPDA